MEKLKAFTLSIMLAQLLIVTVILLGRALQRLALKEFVEREMERRKRMRERKEMMDNHRNLW